MRYTLLPAALLFAAALAFAPANAGAADVDAAKTEQVRAGLAKFSDKEKKEVVEAAVKVATDKAAPAAARIGAIRSLGLLQCPCSVSALKSLFNDEAAIVDEARAALQRIPGADSVSALLAGLGTVKDPVLQAGFLESLGRLQAASAVLTIKGFIGTPEPASTSAQRALAAIATPDAFDALKGAPDSELKRDLLLDAASKVLGCPKCTGAARASILATIREISGGADKEAAYSAFLLRFRFQDADATKGLNSDNVQERSAATAFLFTSRDIESGKVLEAALATVQGDALIPIVGAIAGRGLTSAAPVLRARIGKESNPAVKAELLKALGQIGSAADVAFFVSFLGADEATADAAKAALAQIRGVGIADAFVSIIADSKAKTDDRLALLGIARRRDLRDAVAGLLPVLSDPNEDIRIGALKIVEVFASKAQLPLLEAAKPTQKDTAARLADRIKKLQNEK